MLTRKRAWKSKLPGERMNFGINAVTNTETT